MLQCKLQYWRKKVNISQNKLAQKSGVAQSEISDIESLKISPTLNTIYKLAEALDICPKLLINCDKIDCNYTCINKCKLKNPTR